MYISPVAPCTHCGYCERAVGCSLPDMDGLYADIEGADALVFASPVYNLGFPAPMKAVIDRFQRYYAARFSLGQTLPIAHPKQAVLLSVSGGGDRAGHQYMEMALARQFTVMNTVLAGAVHWPDTDRGGELPEKIRRELAALAATLAKKD